MINKKILFVIFVIFLLGCGQDEVLEENQLIEITGTEPVVEEVEEEYEDNLEVALEELEGIEDI